MNIVRDSEAGNIVLKLRLGESEKNKKIITFGREQIFIKLFEFHTFFVTGPDNGEIKIQLKMCILKLFIFPESTLNMLM